MRNFKLNSLFVTLSVNLLFTIKVWQINISQQKGWLLAKEGLTEHQPDLATGGFAHMQSSYFEYNLLQLKLAYVIEQCQRLK